MGKWRLHTFVPQWLSKNLIGGCVGLFEVLGFVVLLNLGIVVLGVAPVLVEGCGLHSLLNSGYVD